MCERAIARKISSAQFQSKRTRTHAPFDTSRLRHLRVSKKTSMDASSTLQHNVMYSVTLASIDADG